MIDAGFTGTCVRQAKRGGRTPSASITSIVTASRGTLARASAASTSGGRACWAKALTEASVAREKKRDGIRRTAKGIRRLSRRYAAEKTCNAA